LIPLKHSIFYFALAALILSGSPAWAGVSSRYLGDLKELIEANWYPVISDREQKPAEITFQILRSGFLGDLSVKRSSGLFSADQAAVNAILSSIPYKPGDEAVNIKARFGESEARAEHSGIVSGRNQVFLSVVSASQMDEARVYYLSQQWSEARDAFSAVLFYDPANPEAIYKRAVCDLYYYGSKKWSAIRGEKYRRALIDLRHSRELFIKDGDTKSAIKVAKWIDEVENSLAASRKQHLM